MISNITNTFIKAKKAFDAENFTESKNLLNEVINHDKDFLSAYLMLYKIYDKKNSRNKNIIYKELKRLDSDLSIKHKSVSKTKKSVPKNPDLVTLSLIKLMISQGKKIQAKKNLRLIINHSKNKREQERAKKFLKNL
jgi:DNA-binding SARP family transcriptional activator